MDGDDYYSLLYGSREESSEAVAMDAAPEAKKAAQRDSAYRMIKSGKNLISYIPNSKATNIIYSNVSLIKTIPRCEHERITRYIKGVFGGRYTREHLIGYLMKVGDVTEDRATMIADDQIAKSSIRFLVEKWKSQGVKMVRWVHTGGNEPRRYHVIRWNGHSGKKDGIPNGLNGFVFNISNPPVIDPRTNERGYPGQLINCRCHLERVK